MREHRAEVTHMPPYKIFDLAWQPETGRRLVTFSHRGSHGHRGGENWRTVHPSGLETITGDCVLVGHSRAATSPL